VRRWIFSLDVTASPCWCVIVCCHAFFYYWLNYHCASVILESTCIFACFHYIWIFFLISLCTLIFLQSNWANPEVLMCRLLEESDRWRRRRRWR
jgi:hypothetical protein